jgi:phosphopantetheinyl transferase (holo-ACP synthase)
MTNSERNTVRFTYRILTKAAGKDAAKEACYKATLEMLDEGKASIEEAFETLEEINNLYYGG